MFRAFDLKTWLALTVVGSVVSTLGALFGILLKDYLFSRSFERWKQRQTLELLYQRYRDPLLLSARELASRLAEIAASYPTVFLTAPVLASRPATQLKNSTEDAYFRRYKLLSTVYRFCAFLGWLELYRQEITYLHSGSSKHSSELERAISLIREDLADGQLNKAQDWDTWRDALVFREELRAIGESTIETRNAVRTVMGYGRFVELFDSKDGSPTQRWARVLLNFLLDLSVDRQDFRRIRLQRLVVHLVGLLELLDETPVEKRLIEARDQCAVATAGTCDGVSVARS
jgi:uncharacterized membrane protein YbaN (DUF454 family)